METLNNPHDKFFKEVIGQREIARDFLMNYLPPETARFIDFNTISPEKDSFIEKELQEFFSDLLFRIQLENEEAYVYVLFEHKSAVDKPVGLQLLKYMTAIWGKELAANHPTHLPIILPIVFYHGSKKWAVSRSFSGLFENKKESYAVLKKHIPEYEYLVYDFSSLNHEPIRGTMKLRIFLEIVRAIFDEDPKKIIETAMKAVAAFEELSKAEGIEGYFEAYIRYLFYSRTDVDKEELKEQIKTVSKERSETMLTIAEKLIQEGMEKGITKGMEKGMEKGKEELIWKQITKKFPKIPYDYYEKVKGLRADQLDILGLELIDMKDPQELDRFL